MPPYTRQHYLPAVYLKQFSQDGANAKRSSLIWRFDEQQSVSTSVQSQCAEDHFYSLRDAQGTEEMFQKMEVIYDKIMQKIWSGKQPTKRDYFGLILMMVDLHCRNVCYANRTKEENVHAYRVRIHCLPQVFLGDVRANPSRQQLTEHLQAVWRVRLLKTNKGNELATSDNPAVWFTLRETHVPHFIVMPVSLFHCAVAFDKRFSRVIGNDLTPADQSHLNQLQVQNSWQCLFTPTALSAVQQQCVREMWKRREKPSGYVDEEKWSMNLVRADRDCFGFLAKV